MGAPLLIACALPVERLALRGARAHAAVVRTGVGARAAERALRGSAVRGSAVVATGFCGGLGPGMHPGDVVVAEESAGAESLADAVEACGRTAHVGRIALSDHVVRGAERSGLGAGGAVAVDMESAAMMSAALAGGACAVAAARVVVDTPGYELLRFGTLRTGITAFRVLRALVPALLDWHRYIVSLREMK